MARNIMWLLIVSGCAIGVSAVTVICFALDWFGKTYSEAFDFKELQSRKGDVSRNIREIVAALKKYEMAKGEMPYDITEKNKKPLLSWRVKGYPETNRWKLRGNLSL